MKNPEPKHTPGPWTAQRLNPDGVVIKHGGFEISTPNYDVCANVHQGAPIRREADAILIASAPDLAAEIDRLEKHYDTLMKQDMVRIDNLTAQIERLRGSLGEILRHGYDYETKFPELRIDFDNMRDIAHAALAESKDK
jgi:hypothetical protein